MNDDDIIVWKVIVIFAFLVVAVTYAVFGDHRCENGAIKGGVQVIEGYSWDTGMQVCKDRQWVPLKLEDLKR